MSKFQEITRFETPYTQAWLCDQCGEVSAAYEHTTTGESFLLPAANCCAHCGRGPQHFELVSGRWTIMVERCVLKRFLCFGKFHERHRRLSFQRTGQEQQLSHWTEHFLPELDV